MKLVFGKHEANIKWYLEIIPPLAPNKPIIVAQTGVVPDFSSTGENNYEEKNEWIRDS